MKNIVVLTFISLIICQCKNVKKENSSSTISQNKLNKSLFITENLTEPISTQEVTLENGSTKLFYKIVIKPEPKEHQTGPWCPKTITDAKENGGIWFKDGHLYDVDGNFITHLDKFYSDPKWKVYREDGTIKITNTQEACEGAAKPNVEEKYHNYCVECLPNYYKNIINTYLIPVNPVYKKKSSRISRNGIGLAFNGVKFDGPAPIHAIVAAHTIAPLDDCGGHVNPHSGYHYHAATGCIKQVNQQDQHSALIGYAMDGFGIYTLLDKNESKPTDLDECGGHKDSARDYHYHVGEAASNQIIPCLHGEIAPSPKRPRH